MRVVTVTGSDAEAEKVRQLPRAELSGLPAEVVFEVWPGSVLVVPEPRR